MSPKMTKADRKASSDLLEGNLFDCWMGETAYKSILDTVNITGKKKHYQKVFKHILEHLPDKKIPDSLLLRIIEGCKEYEYPVMLGKFFKQMLDEKVEFSEEAFVKFYLYLD